MKYRAKAEKVDAIQVRFGKSLWPEWLKGWVLVPLARNDEGDVAPKAINDGDYLVREGDEVKLYTADEFAAKYERVREPKAKAQS